MPHGAFIGQTTAGKTYAAQQLGAQFRAAGVGVLVLHKRLEPWACASWQTEDPDRFIAQVKRSRGCAVFMELADAHVGKYDVEFHRLFSEGRHLGHRCFYLSQRAASVHPAIRENCEMLWLFTVTAKGAALWAEDFCDEGLLKASTLPKHWFMYKPDRYTKAIPRILR